MHRERRLITAVTVTGACLLGIGVTAACGVIDKSTIKDDATVTDTVSAVRIDNDAGAVIVRGVKGAKKTAVHREINYRGDHRPDAKTYQVSGGTLTLRGCGSDCAVSYTVDVPAGIRVDGKNTAGEIRLSEVGPVDVGTTSGEVTLEHAGGPISVTTSNGRISGRDLAGPRIDAETSNGEIELAPSAVADVRASTSNGAVKVTVPNGRYRVSARTSNGGREIGVPNDPSAPHHLDLKTTNGAITVKRS